MKFFIGSSTPVYPRATAGLGLGLLLLFGSVGCTWVGRASVDSAGTEAIGWSYSPALSADGRYVAFSSSASNLVAGDTNGYRDIFVRDTIANTTSRMSVDSAGDEGNGHSHHPALSADGRYVTFSSTASNLVAGDTNGLEDIFVRDTISNTTIRVSIDSTGNEGNANSDTPALSADGRYVAFMSWADNLVAGDTNGYRDIFVRDTIANTTTRVSVDSAGNEGNEYSHHPALSADGRYVAFSSLANNLVAGDTNGHFDVFVRDTISNTTSRVSVDSAGNEGNSFSGTPALSANGRYIAFMSRADNLVTGDTNGFEDIFVRDTIANTTTRVDVDSAGNEGNGISGSDYPASENPVLSADGRYVAFSSWSDNLVTGDSNNMEDIFVRDTIANTTSRVSVDSAGNEGNGYNQNPALSADGRYVAFSSWADNLVAGDSNDDPDIFVRANPVVSVLSVVPDMLPIGATTSITITGTNFLPGSIPIIPDGTVSNFVLVNETTMTLDLTVDSSAASGSVNVSVALVGTGAGPFTGSSGLCAACITFF
jgi:Tol biopolymer transport system component